MAKKTSTSKAETKKKSKGTTKTQASLPNQSLRRAMRLLERLAEAENGISMTELSQQVGLPTATAHRILNTFEELGFVQHDADVGLWYVGVKAFIVGSSFVNQRDFILVAQPFMRTLMQESGETVNLAILENGKTIFLRQVQSRQPMRMITQLGSTEPAHASGAGKALLAALPDYEVRKILHQHGLERFTDTTIDSPSELLEELQKTRSRGYATDDEEHALGLRCIAATLHDEFGVPLAAISVSGPKVRIDDNRMSELGALVSKTARKITEAMGGRIPTPAEESGAST